MKIVLVGYRAAGKSTLGLLLAQRLGWPYMDIDRGIETRIDKTLSEFYEEVGEESFRRLETEVVEEMCRKEMKERLSTRALKVRQAFGIRKNVNGLK